MLSVQMTKVELKKSNLKNHKNKLGVEAKGGLCEIKGLIKFFFKPRSLSISVGNICSEVLLKEGHNLKLDNKYFA